MLLPRVSPKIGAAALILFGICFFGAAPTSWAAATVEEALLQAGINRYEKGDISGARAAFEKIKSASPDNPKVHYYLGRIYVEEGLRAEGISEWRKYLSAAPESEDSRKIAKYLTLLLREEAALQARKALAGEALLSTPGPGLTLAITPFRNTGDPAYGPIGKGFAAMLIHDLSRVPGLTVLERMNLAALLEELKLGSSGIVAPDTAPRIGKLAGAGYVDTGSIGSPTPGELQIVSLLVKTDRASAPVPQEAQGPMEALDSLEKSIARRIIEALGPGAVPLPDFPGSGRPRRLGAFLSFSMGLDAGDQKKDDAARAWFKKAAAEDPGFDLPRETLLRAPLSVMTGMSRTQMMATLVGENRDPEAWRAIFQAMLTWKAASDEERLKRAISLALMDGNGSRACECLQMAAPSEASPYLILRILLESGEDVKIEDLCRCRTEKPIPAAVLAKAATDAVAPLGRPAFGRNEILQAMGKCQGLPYTKEDEVAPIIIDPDPPPPVSRSAP